MQVDHVIQTCGACPSQWEGKTDRGHNVYVRYRWGYLSVRVSIYPKGNAVFGVEVYGEKLGDDYDGSIDWGTVEEKIKDLDALAEVTAWKKEKMVAFAPNDEDIETISKDDVEREREDGMLVLKDGRICMPFEGPDNRKLFIAYPKDAGSLFFEKEKKDGYAGLQQNPRNH